jgi:hypothetical protein
LRRCGTQPAAQRREGLCLRPGTAEEELRRAFAGAGWHVPPLLDRPARRNVHPFAPADRFQPLAREAAPRLAARPVFAPVVELLLNRGGERL